MNEAGTIRVQVNGQNAVDASNRQHISYGTGRDRYTGGARTTILAGITKVRNNGSNTCCRCTAQSIGQQQDFHQVVVGRSAGRLDDKNIFTTDIFIQLDGDFAIAELTDSGFTQRDIKTFHYQFGQFWIGVTGKDH